MAFQRTLMTAAVAFGSIGRTWTMLSMKRVWRAPRPSPWLLAATAYKGGLSAQYGNLKSSETAILRAFLRLPRSLFLGDALCSAAVGLLVAASDPARAISMVCGGARGRTLPVAAIRGPPVLRTLSLCTCCRHYPGAAAGRTTSLCFIQPYQPSPKGSSGRPAHRPFRDAMGQTAARLYHRHLRQYVDGASHFTTQRLKQVPHFPGARQRDHCGNRDESIELARRRHRSRHRAPSAEEA